MTRVLTWLEDRLTPVPCSRSDVFATEAVSIVEKRMLMKMLTSIVGYNEDEMNNEFKGKSFIGIALRFIIYLVFFALHYLNPDAERYIELDEKNSCKIGW